MTYVRMRMRVSNPSSPSIVYGSNKRTLHTAQVKGRHFARADLVEPCIMKERPRSIIHGIYGKRDPFVQTDTDC